jgi:hypothetical protein
MVPFAGVIRRGIDGTQPRRQRPIWQRQDSQASQALARSSAILAEKKELYPQLLSKGIEFEYAAGTIGTPPWMNREDDSRTPEDVITAIAKIWPDLSVRMSEFGYLISRVDLIGGPEVRRLAALWSKYLVGTYTRVQIRLDLKTPLENPQIQLVAAMRDELMPDHEG